MSGTGLDGVCWGISVSVGIHDAVPRVECAHLPQSHAVGRPYLAASRQSALSDCQAEAHIGAPENGWFWLRSVRFGNPMMKASFHLMKAKGICKWEGRELRRRARALCGTGQLSW